MKSSTYLSALLSTLIAVLLTCLASIGQAQTISSETFNPLAWGPSELTTGIDQFSLTVTSPGGVGSGRYVNVVRADGTWVVQNMRVGMEPGTVRMAANFAGGLFDPAQTYQTTLTATPAQSAPAFVSGTASTLGAAINYLANDGEGITDFGPLGKPGPLPPKPPIPDPNVPTIHVYHEGVPNIPQGTNQCAPTACADSLYWLTNTNRLKTFLTPEDIRDELVTDMGTNKGSNGTSSANIIKGKDQFDSDHHLPIETKYIGFGNSSSSIPTISDILQAMKDGEDVELSILYLDSDNLVTGYSGAHMVTLVGIDVTGNPNSPQSVSFTYADPSSQDAETFGQVDTLVAPGNPFDGRLRLGGQPNNVIRYAIEESVVPEPGVYALLGSLTAAALLRRNRVRKSR